jgi:hypothetical protein
MRDFEFLYFLNLCMCNFVSADNESSISFIRGNKVPHTKVQYLPRYRDPLGRGICSRIMVQYYSYTAEQLTTAVI